MVRGRTALVAIAALGLTACSGGGEGAEDETVTVTATDEAAAASEADEGEGDEQDSEESSSSSSSNTSSPTSTQQQPSTPASAGLPTGAGSYADGFISAWGLGDRPDASRYATEEATSSLFAYRSRGGSSWVQRDSIVQGSRTQVRYTDGDGGVVYVLVDTAGADAGAADAVVAANSEQHYAPPTETAAPEPPPSEPATGLPSSTRDYADALVRAWGNDDQQVADDYATDSALQTLWGDLTPGESDWRYVSSTPTSATYTDDDGGQFTLLLTPSLVSSGRGDAVYGVSVG